jgi:hypothetical protein
MRRKTPQEKKRLSLQKDRRNVYGEAPHASRKNVPLRKKLRNRANRHRQESLLPAGPLHFDVDDADAIKSSMLTKAPQAWEKYRDAPLAEVIQRKQSNRELRRNNNRARVFVLQQTES